MSLLRPSRRAFVQGVGLAGLGLLTGCGRLPLVAPPPAPLSRVHRIGYLSSQQVSPNEAGFRQGLRDYGYEEGQNITIEWRVADGLPERLPALAADLVNLQVEVIVAVGGAAANAARNATSTIPIVMTRVGSDPVLYGLVASLARPGGNVTGLAGSFTEIAGKRLQLLKDAAPRITRVAVPWNTALTAPVLRAQFRETQLAAEVLGVQLLSLELRDPGELESVFEAATREGADALVMLDDARAYTHSTQIVDFVAKNRLPAIYPDRMFVAMGGLMAYAPPSAHLSQRPAYYVDRILKGAKPADLPVEQPREFEFVINLKSAQALGLTIPERVLLQATEVIE